MQLDFYLIPTKIKLSFYLFLECGIELFLLFIVVKYVRIFSSFYVYIISNIFLSFEWHIQQLKNKEMVEP